MPFPYPTTQMKGEVKGSKEVETKRRTKRKAVRLVSYGGYFDYNVIGLLQYARTTQNHRLRSSVRNG